MKSTSFKKCFAIFNPQNLKQKAMPNARPQPSATVSLRMYVLVVIAVPKNPVTWGTGFLGGLTDRGYTMHEHLDDFGLINMNGRIYDPLLGRFLSPDNHIQSPDNPQNYNRYAYALNNPLVYTDPSGEIIVPMLIGSGVSILTNGISNVLNNESFFSGAGKAAIIGGIGGAASWGIGQAASNMSGINKIIFQTLAHAHLGGKMSQLGGGSYEQGFLSGALGSLTATTSGSLLKSASRDIQVLGTIGGGSLAGGVGAEIAGGNFWDGARNGAISAGLNHAIHSGMLGEGLLVSAITGRTRHLFGPDALSFNFTGDLSCGFNQGIEKGVIAILRGDDAGLWDVNDLSIGIGGFSASAGVEVMKLYTSTHTVSKWNFYGNRTEANLAFAAGSVSVGLTAMYSQHDYGEGFTFGYGLTIGLDAVPINVSFNINRGVTTDSFMKLDHEYRFIFD